MTRKSCASWVCVALVLGAFAQAPAFAQERAAAAVKASPDLVNMLSKEMGSTPEQAAGAAGALFGVAKSRMKPEDFAQVAKAVPGMDSLLGAVPGATGAVGTTGGAASLGGAAGGLASATSAFSKLGLSPDMVNKAIPILTQYVSKSGGANVGNLLAGVLK